MEFSSPSEAPAKRQKLAQSLNPFEKLHPDVHELIFQHLRSAEVLQASMVSRSCFAATESSNKCGEKLWLHVKGSLRSGPKTRSQSSNKSSILMDLKSSRKYRNIKITGAENLVGVLSLLKSQKWKQVEMRDITFGVKQEMLYFFKIIQATAETIKCDSVYAGFMEEIPDDNVAELTFPMLKELKITNCFIKFENFFVGCKSLKKLHYACWNSSWNLLRNSKLEKILGNNSNIEASLHFSAWSLNSLAFFKSITRYQFKLRSLVIREEDLGEEEEDLDVILELFQRQAENLQQLELDYLDTMTYKTIETIQKMPNLKSLKIYFDDLEIQDWDNVQLTTNSSIEKLEFHGGSVGWTKFLTKLLQSMPSLKSLCIFRLDENIMQSLGPSLTKIMTKIEELSVDHLVLNHSWFYNVRVKSKDSNICIAVKKIILAKSPEHRSELEKLIIGDNE